MGPHSWGWGFLHQTPAGLGPAGVRGAGQDTPGRGHCLTEAPRQRVCSLACRGHQGKNRQSRCLSGFELKLCFPSVLVSLSRSEPEQGQEQRRASPIQPLCTPAGSSWRRVPAEGRAGHSRPGPRQRGGRGTVAPGDSCPAGGPDSGAGSRFRCRRLGQQGTSAGAGDHPGVSFFWSEESEIRLPLGTGVSLGSRLRQGQRSFRVCCQPQAQIWIWGL